MHSTRLAALLLALLVWPAAASVAAALPGSPVAAFSDEESEGDLPDGDLPDGDLPDGDLPDQDLPDKDLPDGDLPDEDLPDQDL